MIEARATPTAHREFRRRHRGFLAEVPIRTSGDETGKPSESTGIRAESHRRPGDSDVVDPGLAGDRLQDSLKFLLGDAIVRAMKPSKDTLLLPKRLVSIIREYRARTRPSPPTGAGASTATESMRSDEAGKIAERVDREFGLFIENLSSRCPPFAVVMFGGTTFVQKLRANRPIRLSRAFLERGVHVLFNFHRWGGEEHVPFYTNDLLFQSPTDLTPHLVSRLLDRDLPKTHFVFFVSYPHPSVVRLINRANVRRWTTIYDCRDDWEEFQKVGAAQWYDRSVEEFVVANCDITSCVSRTLCAKMGRLSPSSDIRLSPNAFDPEFVPPGFVRETERAVRVGYFGHLTPQWFDWDSLTWLARSRPDYGFEIVGHGAPPHLDLPENISLLGPMESEEICRLASRWHSAIIPFKMSRLADAVDPIKIYEYLGLHLPVVSFRMPQIASYPHTRTVDDRKSFVTALDEAVKEKVDPEAVSEFLGANTWERRASEYLEWADSVQRSPSCIKELDPAGRDQALKS